tara:strand:+ start:38 stop:409 length:372 start_codon:yes stop_codon:yes gene_type:complete
MGFRMKGPTFGGKKKKEEPEVIRKKLDNGIAGEANNDGTIFLHNGIKKGSKKEKEVIAHEGQHIKDMKSGKLAYGDDWIEWNGKKYDRQDGMINYKGAWLEEGYKDFPWEKVAYKAGDKIKNK